MAAGSSLPEASTASLLRPGSNRAAGLADDPSLIAAMLRVEAAWGQCLADGGAATEAQARAVGDACVRLAEVLSDPSAPDASTPDVRTAVTAESAESAGNPAVPLVTALRAEVRAAGTADAEAAADLVHRGLTSQDVLDTALMRVAADALDAVAADLVRTADALAGLARAHRDTIMAGRTLTQPAVPITFGLKAARWLTGVLDAADAVDDARRRLPVQCGGAAGTLSLAGLLVPDPLAAAAGLARGLGLADPGLPWHTQRGPVTRLGDTLATACQALGALGADIATLSRPEIGEVREGGGGGSSTMPHKRNPVLAVLIRSASIRAPHLAATLHQAAGLANDERPDGAWHAEWPALCDLLCDAATAASQAAELTGHLEIDTDAMARNVDRFADGLLAEPAGLPAGVVPGETPQTPADYTGAAGALVDRALARYESPVGPHERTHGEQR